MKVSIIIPVYNVEKYINKCIKSVLEQTYKNLEIILINDGSVDKSGMICDEFAKLDARLIVIHKANGGLSSARNTGIEISTGDYVMFLDSDDFISIDCVERLLNMCITTGAEISVLKMLYVSENTNATIENTSLEKITIFSKEDAIEESLYQHLFSCCAPGKLYKQDIVKNVKFPIGKLSEDLATCHLFIDKSNKVVFSNKVGYFYRQHSASIMHNFNPRRLDALTWAHNIEKFCEQRYPNIVSAARCRTFNVAVHLILDLPSNGEIHDQCYYPIWEEIKRKRMFLIIDKKARTRDKLAAIISFGGEKLLKLFWNTMSLIRRKE